MSPPTRFWILCSLAGLLSGCLKEVPATVGPPADPVEDSVVENLDVLEPVDGAGSLVGRAEDAAGPLADTDSSVSGQDGAVGPADASLDTASVSDDVGDATATTPDATASVPDADAAGTEFPETADDASDADDTTSVVPPPVDECAAGLDDCDDNATCEDTASGFNCICLPGFSGDGTTCSDLDECTEGLSDCAPNAQCTNEVGGWSCECPVGFEGPGTSCSDINECVTGADNCHGAAQCINLDGGFECECQEGFEGDGVNCVSTAPDDPPAIFLTVSRIPDYLNGSLPYFDGSLGADQDFYVRTARGHTCLDVALLAGSGPVDWSSLTLSCDRAFIAEELHTVAAGESHSLGDTEEEDGWRSVCLAFTEPLVDAVVNCSASVNGPSGKVGAAVMDFLTTPLPANLDPMSEPQTWVLSFERDLWSHTAPIGFLGLTNTYMTGGNGVRDFDEAMAAIGLMDLSNSAVSDWAREQLKEAIKRHITACYDPRDDGGIPISFLIEGEDGAPSIDEFNFGPRTDIGFSVLPIGGWDPKGDDVWGRCPYDANNQRNEDVSQTPDLGVMAGQIASAILTSNMNVGYPSELVPQVGGLAFGGDFADGIVLGPTFDVGDPFLPDRVEAVLYAIELVAAFTALVGCHEVGHSLGLLPNGPPPEGLFGGVLGPSWVGEQTTPMHCEIGQNIMGAAISIYDAYVQLTEPRMFTSLVEAYLRSEIVVGEPDTNARIVFFWPFPNSVPNGVVFEACLDSNAAQFCETGGQSGYMTFYDLPSNTYASVQLTGGPFAPSLYHYFFYAVPEPDQVYDYWANVIEQDDVDAVRDLLAIPDKPQTGTVWSSVLTYLDQAAYPGITQTQVTLNGETDGAYCVTSLSPLNVIDASMPLPAGTSCEHYVFFNVPEGQHTLAVYGTDGDVLSPKSCIPLAAWSQYGGYIATLDVAEGLLTRPLLACE